MHMSATGNCVAAARLCDLILHEYKFVSHPRARARAHVYTIRYAAISDQRPPTIRAQAEVVAAVNIGSISY